MSDNQNVWDGQTWSRTDIKRMESGRLLPPDGADYDKVVKEVVATQEGVATVAQYAKDLSTVVDTTMQSVRTADDWSECIASLLNNAERLVGETQQGGRAQTEAIARLSEAVESVASRSDLAPELRAIVEVLTRCLDRQAAIQTQLVSAQQQLSALQMETARWRGLAADFESVDEARYHLIQAARFKALMVHAGKIKGPAEQVSIVLQSGA
jgi:ABC-type transporter Mla subunit MlaD